MIPDSAVASPVAVTWTRRLPPAATVPATTLSPVSLVTAADSPVIIDSSTSAEPSTTTPSAGTRAPGRTRTTSPSWMADSGTSSVPASVTRSAVSGSSSASAARAPRAWAMERISSQWPSSMIVMRDASSHHTSTSNRPSEAASEVTNATVMARLMSSIIPGLRSRISERPPRRKTRPPYTNTTVPRTAGSGRCPGRSGPGIRATPGYPGSR